MATTTKVPGITPANIASDEKIAQAVQAGTESEKRNEQTKGQVAMFLYSVTFFRDDVTAKDLAETYGAKTPAISKAGKVIRHYVSEMFPDRETPVTVSDVASIAEMVNAEWSSVFDAYRSLFPTTPKGPRSLIEKGQALYKEWKNGNPDGTPDDFALFMLGCAQVVEDSGDDENDDDQ